MRYCQVISCFSDKTTKSQNFFLFPNDNDQCQKWVQFCHCPCTTERFATKGLAGVKHYTICEDHFHPDEVQGKGNGRLPSGVVPRYIGHTYMTVDMLLENGFSLDEIQINNDEFLSRRGQSSVGRRVSPEDDNGVYLNFDQESFASMTDDTVTGEIDVIDPNEDEFEIEILDPSENEFELRDSGNELENQGLCNSNFLNNIAKTEADSTSTIPEYNHRTSGETSNKSGSKIDFPTASQNTSSTQLTKNENAVGIPHQVNASSNSEIDANKSKNGKIFVCQGGCANLPDFWPGYASYKAKRDEREFMLTRKESHLETLIAKLKKMDELLNMKKAEVKNLKEQCTLLKNRYKKGIARKGKKNSKSTSSEESFDEAKAWW